MKKNQRKLQFSLVLVGLLLFFATYLLYPDIREKEISGDRTVGKNFEKTIEDKDQITNFESLEYKGMYDLDKPFVVKSDNAYMLNNDPDIIYMKNMHVILYLNDGRVVNILSDQGIYNKKTYDCFFEQNVKATDENTVIFADNLDLLAAKNSVDVYNNVFLNYETGNLSADKITYNFETKYFKVSMFDDKRVKVKVIR